MFPLSSNPYSSAMSAPTWDATGSSSAPASEPASASASAVPSPMPTPSGTPTLSVHSSFPPPPQFSLASSLASSRSSTPNSSPPRGRVTVSRTDPPDGTGHKVVVTAARCLFGTDPTAGSPDSSPVASPRCPPLPLAAVSAVEARSRLFEELVTSPRSSFEPLKKVVNFDSLPVFKPDQFATNYSCYPPSTYFSEWAIPSEVAMFRYEDMSANGIVFKVWDRKERKCCAFAIFERGKTTTIQGKFPPSFAQRKLEQTFSFPIGELDPNPILFKEQHLQFLTALVQGVILADRFSLYSPDLES